jgi:hypothetical protein
MQLLAEGVELESHGGSIQVVHTSAKSRLGLDDLLEALTLQAEMMELTASHDGPASAVVVEARMDKKEGVSRSARGNGLVILDQTNPLFFHRSLLPQALATVVITDGLLKVRLRQPLSLYENPV